MVKHQSAYEKLLLLYPKQYRKKYGPAMAQTMEDVLAGETNNMRKSGILLKEIILLPGNVLEQHMIAVSRRGGVRPATIVSLVALALLVPFFMAIVLDEVSEHLYGQHLYNSWAWSQPVLTTWVIVLPLLSLFISLITYVLLAIRASMQAGKITFQIKKLWLVIVAGVISAGILFIVAFHDSAHCWLGNPVSRVTQLNTTVRCTENGFLGGDTK